MPAERFTSPVGRLVQGDAFTPQTKDQQGNPRVIKTGPNAGQPNPQFYVGVAFRKDDPQWPAFWALIDRVARSEWPSLFPNPQAGCVNPHFAFKVLDGDGVDQNGKSNALKEGWAGHFVVRFTSSFPPKVFRAGAYNPQDQVTDPQALKRGYFVRINGSAKGNDNPQRPGLYLNFDLIEIAGYGQEIVSGPDAGEAFGQAATYIPPGMSATPLLPGGPAGAPPMMGAPGPGAPAPGYPAAPPAAPGYPAAPPAAPGYPAAPPAAPGYPPPGAPPAAPGYPPPGAPPTPSPATGYPAPSAGPGVPPAAAPAPYTGYMPGSPPAAPAAPPAAPVGPQMTAKANGVPYEQFRAQGWTDEQLRAEGYLV